MKKKISILFFLVFTSIFSQTGPGGVGSTDGTSNLVLWLNPDEGSNTGSTWTDQSGNSFNFGTGTGATLNTSDINGYNSYSFNGSSNYFEKSFESTLNPTAFSVFSVSNVTSSGSYKAIVSSRDDPSGTPTRGFILYAVPSSNNWSFWTGRNSGSWQTTGTTTSTAGSWASQNLFYENVASGKRLFINNALNSTSTHNMTLNTSRPFRVGAGRNETSPDYYFEGKMGEIIMFDAVMNSAERIIINNYLSAKYNFTLSTEDFYNEDTTGGDFDHNVAGIGQASDGTNHTDSQGTGIIRISNPSGLGNDEFLFWGEDVKDANYTFSSSSSTNYIERIDTKWRVSRRNNPGRVTVRVNASDLTFNSTDGCNQLQLVVDNNSDFSSPDNTYTFTLSGGVYTATSVRLRNNRYFTLQYADQIVLDGATAYNGTGGSNKPNTDDDCYKLLVKTNTLTLSENGDVREVEVESGAILAVDTGYRLQVTNGINNAGEIRLVGTSQLVQTHTGTNLNTGTGNLFVDQTASTSSAFHSGYWTSPVTTNGSTFTIDGVLKDGTVPTAATSTAGEAANINFIAGFNGDASASPIEISTRWLAKLINAADWTRFLSTTATLNPAEGWNMKSMGTTFTFKGRPNDGDYSIAISKDKFSLVGNPYPSALDSEDFISDNILDIKGTLYIYNSASDNTHVRNAYTGSYSTIVSGVTIGGGRYLPIGQAFFVTREVAGSGNVTFQNSQRENIIVSNTATIVAKGTSKKKEISKYIKTEKDFQVLRLGFGLTTDDNFKYRRQIAVAFREGKTFKYDNGYDGEMIDKKPSDLAFKIEDNEKPFVISTIQKFDDDIEIPLTLDLDKNREVTFKIDALENFDDVTIYLNDKLTGNSYNLLKSDVSLDLIQGNYSDRFFITFKYELLEDAAYEYIKLYHKDDTNSFIIRKSNPIDVQEIKIYDINGRLVFEEANKNQKNRLEFLLNKELRTGVYIIKVSTDKGTISQKIAL